MNFGIFSSFYVLATSDIFSDIILAVILLFYEYYILNFNYQRNVKNVIGNNDENGFNITDMTMNCNVIRVLYHYAIFLVPLANSFISLIGKSLQCNYYIKCIEMKCDRFIISSSDDYPNLKCATSAVDSLKSQKHKYTLAILSIISQWIVPIILITILYTIAEQNKYESRSQLHDSTCTFAVNFPLNNCYNKQNENIITICDDNINFSLDLKNNYTENDETTELFLKNSTLPILTTADEIISRIWEIVQSINNISKVAVNTDNITELHNSIWNPLINLNKTTRQLSKNTSYINILNTEFHVDENDSATELNTILLFMNNECFISPNTLKIYLLISLLIIYFGTIFVLMISYIKCQYLYAKIIEKLKTVGDTEIIKSIVTQPLGISKENINIESTTGNANINNDQQHSTQQSDIKIEFENTKEQANNVRKLVLTFRMTIFLALIMWTPVLLDILTKVFLCFQIPNWLTNILYLIAVSFKIIRNITNIHMIKNRQILPQSWIKHNSIHPMSIINLSK
ncbi:hypothetical protein PV327_004770 [Microctonus hyperodae]|uniref:G-protein coupled receptors family 1 profile domain-containing protein n=1 Tax=Microctonus hyperodae TaxID=165561 RepID=A0AA39KMW2_MICHY|nr:hypothetical protein PV327_004770 [Microctonus hyperodae]